MDAIPTLNLTPPILSKLALDTSPAILATTIDSSHDKLFFISYVPEGTARPRWYLVHVDQTLTDSDPNWTDSASTGTYHVHFLLQHPSDRSLGHASCRWWPQWNRITICPSDGIMDYGAIQLFSPTTTPDCSTYRFAIPPVILSALSTSNPAFLLLTATALSRQTYGTNSLSSAKPAVSSPPHYPLPHPLRLALPKISQTPTPLLSPTTVRRSTTRPPPASHT
jgi:hypothetical protein